MNNEEIRREARELLKDKWGSLALIWLILYGISAIAGIIPFVGSVGYLFVGGQITLGICAIFLKLLRKEDFRVEEMFDGFKDYTRTLVAYLLITLYVVLWSLLLIVPGVIASISYSMTFFIMAEDPRIEAQDAMKKSQQMMYGHKTEYFMLMLSFIGWALLCILTVGIGLLFLSSYTSASAVIFYQRIKPLAVQQPEQEQQVPPEIQ